MNTTLRGIPYLLTDPELLMSVGFPLSADCLDFMIGGVTSSMACFDIESRYIALNQSWISQLENGRCDQLGKNYYAYHPETPEYWREIHQEVLRGLPRSKDVEHWKDSDGTDRWTRWSCYPWLRKTGTIGGFVVSVENTTPYHQALAELRQVNQRYRAIA